MLPTDLGRVELYARYYKTLSPSPHTLRAVCSACAEQLHTYLFQKRAEGKTYLLTFTMSFDIFIQLVFNIGLAKYTTYNPETRTWKVIKLSECDFLLVSKYLKYYFCFS